MSSPRDGDVTIQVQATAKQYAEKIRDRLDLQETKNPEDPVEQNNKNNIIINAFGLSLNIAQRQAIERAMDTVFEKIAKFEKQDKITAIKAIKDEKISNATKESLRKWYLDGSVNLIRSIFEDQYMGGDPIYSPSNKICCD